MKPLNPFVVRGYAGPECFCDRVRETEKLLSSLENDSFWIGSADAPFCVAWEGLAFERLCLQHVREIKSALGISGVVSTDCAWQVARTAEHEGAQVDLLIDRRVGVINLCEMKFASSEYEIKDRDERHVRARRELFKEVTGTRKAVHLTYVTTYGLKRNAHAGFVQSEVRLEDLFR